MENKDNLPAGGKIRQLENKPDNLLKQKINTFLINYFNYLTWAIAFIILFVGLFLFVYPQYKQITKDNEAADKNLQAEYEAKYNDLSAIRNLKKLYQTISDADRKKIEAMVPVGNKTSNLIPEIESIILRNGAALDSIKVEADDPRARSKEKLESGEKQEPVEGIFEQPPQGVNRIKIEVNLSSVNYSVLKNIIKTLEVNLRLLDVAKIDYSVNENKAILTIYTFYLP